MKSVLAAAVALLALATPALAASPSIEIRFCPSAQVRTYPMDTRRGVKSLVLQNVAIVNRGAKPFAIENVAIELLRAGEAVDTRSLPAADLDQIGQRDAKIAASGMLSAASFQFCGKDLIKAGEKLGGRVLAPNEAFLIMQQVFAYGGVRDQLRVRVEGASGSIAATLPVSDAFAKNSYIFPLRGVWYAGNGPTLHTAHRWALPEEFAFDIAKLDAGGLTHKGDGTKFSDYYAYGADVLAAADGRVVAVENGQPEDASVMQRPDETQEAYFARLLQSQAGLLAKGTAGVAGNYVMIDHGQGEYSLYAHLQPGSVRVHAGDAVKAGDVIAKLGSSGNSTEPHLHFQVCDNADPLMCAGIPVNFTNVVVQFGDLPRPLQSGDVVVAK